MSKPRRTVAKQAQLWVDGKMIAVDDEDHIRSRANSIRTFDKENKIQVEVRMGRAPREKQTVDIGVAEGLINPRTGRPYTRRQLRRLARRGALPPAPPPET